MEHNDAKIIFLLFQHPVSTIATILIYPASAAYESTTANLYNDLARLSLMKYWWFFPID